MTEWCGPWRRRAAWIGALAGRAPCWQPRWAAGGRCRRCASGPGSPEPPAQCAATPAGPARRQAETHLTSCSVVGLPMPRCFFDGKSMTHAARLWCLAILQNPHTGLRAGARVTFMSRYWMGARRRGPQPPPRPRERTRSRSSFRSSSLERILSMAAQPLRFHRFPWADASSSEAHSCLKSKLPVHDQGRGANSA